MAKHHVCLPYCYLEEMEMLTDEEFGRLCRGLIRYAMDGTELDSDGNERFFFKRVVSQEDLFAEKYTETCNKRRAAINKRWHPDEEQPNTESDTNVYKSIQTNTNVYNGIQTHTNDTKDKDKDKHKDKDKDKSISINSAEQKTEPAIPDSESVIALPLISDGEFCLTQIDIDIWADTYPAVDVLAELKKMKAWLEANPKRKKTARGIKSFVNSWLAKEQDRGGTYRQGHQARLQSIQAQPTVPAENPNRVQIPKEKNAAALAALTRMMDKYNAG